MTSNKRLFKIFFIGIAVSSCVFSCVIYKYQVSHFYRQKENYQVDNIVTARKSGMHFVIKSISQ